MGSLTQSIEISKIEVDRALACIQSVLMDEKRYNYPNGIPLICVTGLETLETVYNTPVSSKEKDKSEKKEPRYESHISKFLDFCVYVSDNRLGHVVMNTTRDFANVVLDKRMTCI